jgi:hypothetical protein
MRKLQQWQCTSLTQKHLDNRRSASGKHAASFRHACIRHSLVIDSGNPLVQKHACCVRLIGYIACSTAEWYCLGIWLEIPLDITDWAILLGHSVILKYWWVIPWLVVLWPQGDVARQFGR